MSWRLRNILGSILSSPAGEFARQKEENQRRIIRDEEHRRSRPEGLPVYISIETTRACNLSCRMCPYHSSVETRKKWGVPTGTMNEDAFRVVARQLFPTLQTCSLAVTGEFTLTDYLPVIFNLFGKYGVRFRGFTNATLLTPEISGMMMPHLGQLTVGVDSPVPKTYEFIKRGAKWGAMLENVKTLMAAREKIKTEPRPLIELQAVLMRSNIESFPELARMAKRMGFDVVKGVHLGVFSEDMIEESLVTHRDLYNKIMEDAVAAAKEAGIEIRLPPPLVEKTLSPEQKDALRAARGCEYLWRRSFINFDGAVFACCAPRPPLVGNLTGAGFEDAWRGAAYRSLRNRIYTDDPHPSCARCATRNGNIPEGLEEEYLFHIEKK